jgi:hypothetical protein
MESFDTGTASGVGSYQCEACGFAVALQATDELPECPSCGGMSFGHASLFRSSGDTIDAPPAPEVEEAPEWLEEVTDDLPGGFYLAFEGQAGVEVLPLAEGWTRIGRSLSADVRIDDPTVSRRHALVHRQGSGVKALDDRSLNGTFRNGEQIDLAELHDGDTLAVGRFQLHILQVTSDRQPVAAGA